MKNINNKVLIITYYWPPSGGSGVQRWLKFVKYLPQFGWEPFVFTPENPSFAIRDESLLKDVPVEADVIHFPIWEPYEMFFKISKLTGNKYTAKPTDLVSGKKKSFFQFVSTWIRGNFFIPDPRRFWVKPSVSFLHEFLEENKINTIITTGPPHSMHLIGLNLKRKNPSLRWIADFRDPWSEWGLLDSLHVGAFARKYHQRLEASVLSNADDIITITPFYVRQFEKLSQRKIQLLTNGFDEDDFQNIVYNKSENFLIRHVGIINEKCDPRPFMNALKELFQEDAEFSRYVKIEFFGEVHPSFRQFVSDDDVLKAITHFAGNIPHKQLIQLYGNTSLWLLILTGYKDAEGFLPGKLFEYLATGLPILSVGPIQSDAGVVLKEAEVSEMIGSDDHTGMKKNLQDHFTQWKNSSLLVVKKSGAKKYSRKEVTKNLSELLLKSQTENPSPAP